MMRSETIVSKSKSDLRVPKKITGKKYSRQELDDMIVRLAEAHGMLK